MIENSSRPTWKPLHDSDDLNWNGKQLNTNLEPFSHHHDLINWAYPMTDSIYPGELGKIDNTTNKTTLLLLHYVTKYYLIIKHIQP